MSDLSGERPDPALLDRLGELPADQFNDLVTDLERPVRPSKLNELLADTTDPADRTAVLAPIDIARAAVLNRVGTSAKVLEAILKRLDEAEERNARYEDMLRDAMGTADRARILEARIAFGCVHFDECACLLLPPTEDGADGN